MYILLDNISIDFNKSIQFGQLFVSGGRYESMGTLHNFPNFLVPNKCETVNYYANLKRAVVETSDSEDSFHLGGHLCNNGNIQFINPSSECISYKRAFDDSFDISTNKIEETVNTCLPGGALNTDYSSAFDIE